MTRCVARTSPALRGSFCPRASARFWLNQWAKAFGASRCALRKKCDRRENILEAYIKLPAEMMKLAQHIIQSKAAEFDASMLEDQYRAALMRILQRKQAKRAAPAPAAAPSSENVINLMEALRRSMAAEDLPKKPAATRAPRSAAPPAPDEAPENHVPKPPVKITRWSRLSFVSQCL